jgi:cyclopropane-fatty-acyl-phospholipid synthase
MTDNIIKQLATQDIHSYGSSELEKFEKQMTRYFEREYKHWENNNEPPKKYGLDSFKGEISKKETRDVSVSHYDEEYFLYKAFLDKEYMAYTMGYFGATKKSSKLNEISLEKAQANKYQLIIERADIQDSQTILDLGCGYGGLSKYLLEHFPNINIIGINPSTVQTNHIIKELIQKNENFNSSRYTLIQEFFDDVNAEFIENNYFDRVISIGLLEHVTNIDLLQKNITRVLKPGGKCLHHCIVSYDTLPNFLNAEDTLMGTYYPGAHIWPYNEPQRHSKHLHFVNSWFINGLNYWKTLDEWHKRFWNSIDQLYPEYMSIEEVDKWNKYFSL